MTSLSQKVTVHKVACPKCAALIAVLFDAEAGPADDKGLFLLDDFECGGCKRPYTEIFAKSET